MPTIIDYPRVVTTLALQGLRPLYPNGGAFGFAGSTPVKYEGWVGADDPTIRAEMLPFVTRVVAPYAQKLTTKLIDHWQQNLPGQLWLMPQSHWHFELSDGAKNWLPDVLRTIGIAPDALHPKNSADAIAFDRSESEMFASIATKLLRNLQLSDFWLAFPTYPVTAILHHHGQVWWMRH